MTLHAAPLPPASLPAARPPTGPTGPGPTGPAPASLTRNITWLAAGNLAVKPLWFVFTTLICIRVLGPAEYGVFVAAQAFSMIVAAFSDWGLSDYAVGEVARQRQATEGPGREGPDTTLLFSNLTVLRVALAATAAVATLVAGAALGRNGPALWALAAAAAYTGALRILEYVRSYFRSAEVLKYEAVSVVGERAATIALGIAGLLVLPSAAGVLAGMALGTGGALVANVLWIHRRLHRFEPAAVSWAYTRRTLVAAFPLGTYGFLSILFLNAGTVILERVAGPVAAGQYGAAYRFVEVTGLFPTVIAAAVYPRLSALHAARSPAFWPVLARSTALAGTVAVGLSVALIVAGPTLLTVAAGSGEFGGAQALFNFVAWQIPLMTVSLLLGSGLMASERARLLATSLVFVVALNVALNAVLVPRYSYVGTAAALLGGQGLAVLLFAWHLGRAYFSTPLPDEPN